MRKLYLYLFVLVVLVCSVSGTRNHFNYGNVDYSTLLEGDSHIVFSSLSPSNHDSTPFSCQIPVAAEFSPVVADFNNDGENWLVYATTGDNIDVYDFGCGFVQRIAYGEDIQAMPVVRNFDGDEFVDIIVMGDSVFTVYEWDESVGQLAVLASMPTYGTNLEGLACDYGVNNLTCLSVDKPSTVVYSLLDFPGNFSTTVIASSNLDTLAESGGIVGGIAGGKFTSPTPEVSLWDARLGNSWIRNMDHSGLADSCATGVSDAAADVDVFSGGLGLSSTATHLFASGYSESPTKRKFYVICDNTYTQVLWFSGQSGAKEDITNWAVTDFDHDGRMDACLIHFNYTGSVDLFKCYDSRMLKVFEVPFNITDGYRSFAMAEFYDTGAGDIQEFLTPDGIYAYQSASDTFELVVNISGDVSDTTGNMIVVESDTSRVNFGVYTQSGRSVVFGFGADTTVTCGDGVCSVAETPFTCPADCLINASAPDSSLLPDGDSCGLNSSACQSGKCMYGSCVRKGMGEVCSQNYECVSGDCSAGKCRKASLWETTEQAKDDTFGDDEKTNNLITIATMVLVSGSIMASGNMFAVIGAIILMFAMGGFFVSVGWLSFWIFMIMIIVALIGGTVVILFAVGRHQ